MATQLSLPSLREYFCQRIIGGRRPNLIISDLRREEKWDTPELGLLGWVCDFQMAGDLKSLGWLIIFTDSEGYVSMVGIASFKSEESAQSSSYVMVAVWESISLTLDEMADLLKKGKTWSSYNNRFYVISRKEDKLVVSLQRAQDS